MPITLDALRAQAPTLAQMEAEAGPSSSMRFSEVQYDAEFYRIAGLPRRPIVDAESPEAQELATFITSRMAKVPVDQLYPGPLWGTQALAIKEGAENNGGIGMIVVSGGKTLIDFLLMEVWRAPRPLILTKAMMIKDMEAERRKLMPYWHIRPAYQCPILSYETLSSPNAGEVLDNDGKVIVKSKLERLAPTHIILDECHCLGDTSSTGARRVEAYLKKFPNTVVWAQTGTMFRTSIDDCEHIFRWALKERSPLPHDFKAKNTWASFLDARGNAMGGVKAGPGALLEFLSAEERERYENTVDGNEQTKLVRQAVSRRILETPGVIGTSSPPLDIPLEITAWMPEDDCEQTDHLFRILRGDETKAEDGTRLFPPWRLPDGTEIPDGMQFARHASNAGYNFWTYWDPDPGQDWRFHRNAWSKWCRRAIRYNKKGIDSEARMKDAVRRGIVNDLWSRMEVEALAGPAVILNGVVAEDQQEAWAAWEPLIGTSRLENWEAMEAAERTRTGLLEPPSQAAFVSEQIVRECERWLSLVGNGLIWVNSIALGEILEQRLEIPYYRAGGVDRKNRHIKQHPGGPAIASIKANGTGRNLQHFWSNNLWLCQPNEQALGRTHRAGQKANAVRNWVYLGCPEHLKSFYAAKATKAAFAEQMQGAPQKLRYAKTTMPSISDLCDRGGHRWVEVDIDEE